MPRNNFISKHILERLPAVASPKLPGWTGVTRNNKCHLIAQVRQLLGTCIAIQQTINLLCKQLNMNNII